MGIVIFYCHGNIILGLEELALTVTDSRIHLDREARMPSGSIGPLGGEGSVSRGWTLAKISIDALLENKSLTVLPLTSTLMLALISIIIFWGFHLVEGFGEMTPEFLLAIVMIYLIANIVIVFFNVALMGASMLWFDGGTPTLGYAIGFARERLLVVIQWAMLVSIVNVLLSLIRRSDSSTGTIVAGISGIAWSVITFFAVPVLAFEKVSPLTAVKRSAKIIKSTWRETLISNLGINFVFLIFASIVLFPLFIALVWVGLDTWMVLFLVSILYWIVLGSIYGAISGVLGTALYRYATTGKVSPKIPETVVKNPWKF